MDDKQIEKLAIAIAQAIANPAIVNAGKVRNPYKQFKFSVADGDIETIYYTYDFWRMLTLSNANGVQIRIGKTGTPSDIVGSGVGNRLPEPVGEIQIINNSGGTITGIIGLAVGDIFDDRLNVSGALDIAVASQFDTVVDVTLAAGVAGALSALDLNRKELFLTNIDCPDLRISGGTPTATNGVPIAVGQTIILTTTALVNGFSVGGGKVAVAEMKA